MNKQAILDGIADVLEVPAGSVTEDTELAKAGNWDSLAVVVTMGLLDEHASAQPGGPAIAACVTAGDVLRLGGMREAL